MITTTYTCDRIGCGKTQENAEQMWCIYLDCHSYPGCDYGRNSGPRALWCRACCDEFYLPLLLPKPKEETAPPLTIEDLIREIVREEVDRG